MVGDSEAEGASREGRAASGGEEEYEAIARSCHDTVLSGNLRQVVCRSTNREGGECLLSNAGRLVAEILWGKHLDMRVPPMENSMCTVFEEYGDVPETVPLKFTEDDVIWVESKLSGAAGALGAEVIELRNWIICFRCSLEELRVVVARLADWMANFYPPP